jgi:benzylsuccinate CoA-transferase BbsE subunit
VLPLSPYRVLDLADEKGLFCGKLLSDLGADVIKIEKTGGDPARNIGPFYHDIPDPEKSLFWFAYNIGKRSITLDIEKPSDRDIFIKLARTAHFVIESFSPGYMDSFGLGYLALREINPRIIMTSITPFGQTGPYKNLKSSDLVTMAMGGFMYMNVDEDRPPVRITVEQSYLQSGAQAAVGTMFAHQFRQITGQGQHVDVSMMESIMWLLYQSLPYWNLQKIICRRGARYKQGNVEISNAWRCKDGFITWRITTGVFGAKVNALVTWMIEEGMAGDMAGIDFMDIDMLTVSQTAMDHWEQLWDAFFLKHTLAEIVEQATKRDIMACPINTIADVITDAQLKYRGFWQEIPHPELGRSITYPGVPLTSTEYQLSSHSRAPLIGEHTVEILRELELE